MTGMAYRSREEFLDARVEELEGEVRLLRQKRAAESIKVMQWVCSVATDIASGGKIGRLLLRRVERERLVRSTKRLERVFLVTGVLALAGAAQGVVLLMS